MAKTKIANSATNIRVLRTLKLIVALVIAVALAVALILLFRTCGEENENVGNSGSDTITGPRERTLAEAPQANFLSIFVYDADGGVASFMVGGKSEEFNSFASAIANAKPVSANADESFSDLLILSFGDKDTLELSYSRKHNLLILGDMGFAPSEDLSMKITEVEKKFN